MLNYTSCKSCGSLLQVVFAGQLTHPTCPQVEEELLARQFVDAIQAGDEAEAQRLEKLLDAPRPAPPLGSVALWYAEQGWPVFPCRAASMPCIDERGCRDAGYCRCPKRPLTKNGLKDASTDPDQIREWWSKWPEANIGGVTGVKYDVLDVDGPQGFASLASLGDDALPDVHGRSDTPHGQHIFLEASGDGNRAGVRPGLDYRGAGGYVLLSPSVVDGKRYSWVMQPSPVILGAHE